MHDEWERMPGMQRLITLDSVIYVHENPKRQRRAPAPVAEPAVSERAEPESAVKEPDLELEATSDGESGEQAVQAAAAPVAEPEVAEAPADESGYVEVQQQGHTVRIVRSNPVSPPPGYAIEFGSGRLVPIHSFRGRMSYPRGVHSN